MDFYFNERKSEHTDGVQTQQKDLISFLKTLDTQDKKIAVTFDSLIKDKSYDKVLYCLNSANLYMFRSTRIEWRDNTIFVTHYKKTEEELRQLGLGGRFLKMGIDLKRIPKIKKIKNGKWIYYGNLYKDKLDTLNTLKKYIDFDIISFNELNSSGRKMSHEECLEKVSEYSYGIGVGKCALEMGAMGLPVLVVGRNLAGTLCDPTDYDFHIKSNTNSDISNSLGMEEDILKLKKIGQTICPTFFTFDKEEWLRLLT